MVVTKLMGGLGNQMFQYATARRIAYRHNAPLKLDLSWFDNRPKSDTPRKYELQPYRLPAEICTQEELLEAQSWAGRPKWIFWRGNRYYQQTEHYKFYPELLTAPRNSYLEGFWQSAKYFEDVASVIRKDFDLPLVKVSKSIIGSLAVSVHVRRGDYANDPATRRFHGLLPLDYFKKAMSLIENKMEAPKFFVFSDDPDWCRKNLRTKSLTILPPSKTPHEDIQLMRHCRHHILSNSSFGWWGAWLNPSPDKIVVAPKQWVADPSVKPEHVVPRDWIRL